MADNKQNKDFMIQGTILAVASILVRVIGMIYRIPLMRIIGDEGMGLYSGAFEVYNIALLLSSYSLPLAVSKLVSARLANGETRNAFKVFKSALIFSITIGLIVALTMFFMAGPIAAKVLNSPMSSYALKVLAPCLFIVAVMGVIRGLFQGFGTMIPTAISQIIEQIVNAVVSVVAAYYLFQAGTKAAAAAQGVDNLDMLGAAYGAAGGTTGTMSGAFAGLLVLILVLVLSRKSFLRKINRDKHTEEESYGAIYRVLFATIIPVVLSSALYNICGVLDQSIFNHVMGAKGMPYKEYTKLMGMYSGKFLLLINVPLAMANALASSSIPSISGSVARKERKIVVQEKIDLAIRFSMLIAIPCFVGFLVLGSPILQLLWGDDRKQMALILAIGSVCVVFYSLSTIENAILQGLNHMRDPLKNAAISLIIHVPLLFVLLMTGLNIYAVVIANTLFSVTMCILNQHDIYKHIGYRQQYRMTYFLPLAAAVVMGIAARGVYALLHMVTGNAVSTLFAILVAVVTYAVMLIVLHVIDEEALRSFPKGHVLIRVFKKVHLLR